MKHNKSLILVIILTGIVITALVLFFSQSKKAGNNSVKPESVSKNSSNDSFRVRPLSDIKFERTEQRLKQGKYLAEALLECFMCHSPRNWDAPGAPPVAEKYGAGGFTMYEDSTTRLIAPNITPDKETGAGTWTDDMFARAIREGVGHDGRALSHAMPYSSFKHLSDEDLASIIVYIRSIPAIHNVVLPTKIPAGERSWTEKSLRPIIQRVPVPDFSDPKKRGHYLVTLADCSGCHTSHAEYSPGIYAGGNPIDHGHGSAFSANITSDPSGMTYGPDAFVFVMRTGKGGTLSHNMPWVALKNITDDDLKAIYAYLRTMPPSQHHVSNQKPFTHCAICGQEHGLGEKNKIVKPVGISLSPAVYDQYTGTYFNEDYSLSTTIGREGNKLIFTPWENGPKIELIPQSETNFLAPGWYLPFNFVKDNNGRITQMVEDTDEGLTYKKIK